MWVYVAAPTRNFTIHRNASCSYIQKHGRPHQRHLNVDDSNVGEVLSQLRGIPFAAQPGLNDLWLEVTLPPIERELRFIHEVKALLGQRYKRIASAVVTDHDCR